ncbi:MAG: group II truncated hemoglobin [Gemmatimonadota bacterium]
MATPDVPTLYEWAGGLPALERLTEIFYQRVRHDDMLAPVFAHMDERHPHFVALFLAEVLGGPATYSGERGGHAHMLSQHLNRRLTEGQRRQWISLLIDSAEDAGLPADPEFRSAFVAYIEWGTRLAVLNSQPGEVPTLDQPMPQWGWGVPGGPYRP